MKKRTLVCFLIFLLCVFHSSIPGTVFGQDDDPSLAQQVFDKYSETLNREDIKAVLPAVLEGLKDPAIQRLLSAATIGLVVDSPDLLVTFVPTIDPEFVQLLKEDQALKDLLSDPLVHSLLQDSAAIDELAGLLGVGGTPPVDPTPPDPAPPTISITTPRPTTARQGSFNVAFATTDANGDPVTVTASISVDPAEAAGYYSSTIIGNSARVTQTAPTTAKPTIPGATVTLTLTANDGTADSTPATIVLTFGAAELPPETPPEPPEKPEPPTGDELPPVDLTTSNLNGTSQVGGLSLNRVHGRAFIRDLIVAASNGLIDATSADDQVERVVDFILAQVPQGFLPKRQIKQMLTANNPSSIFAEEKGSQLDFENFGNAIAPDLTEIIYTNVDNTTKFLASDNLNVYVRVADTLLGGNVEVRINGVEKVDATRITPLVFQQDTIPYTFRLEETLAATNLPALPDADFGGNKIFSGVVLRYSQTGKDGEYISVDMDPVHGERGVVWESEIGIPPPKEARDLAANVYYYFEVTLSEPVTLEIINPEALGAAVNSVDGTHTLEATRTYEINSWAMPDPRNIQLDDRGILEALFTPDVAAKLAPIALSAIGSVNSGDVRIPGNQIRQLQTALLNSANDLFTRFESTFDPMLVSVFSLPYVDIATESLWYANIDSIADGPVNFEALVINANDDVVDHIVADITADDSAPEADINIGTTEHATGYWNRDGVFVSTANPEATPALVNITSTVTKGIVGDGKGYLVYQIIKLDEHGRPLTTWLPLTVVNSMVASDLWDLVIENLPDDLTEFAVPGTDTTLNISQFPLDFILSALQGDVPIPGVEIDTIIIDAIESFVGIRISEDQYALLADLLGAVVDDINLFPITSDPSRMMTIPIQGENMPLMLGDYGIRAMGIDTLFNVGSHVAPTRLRVVVPEWDRTSVTMASLGDLNGDGDADEPYETGTIYSNATDVTLTIMVDERTVHPGTVMVQYLDADGTWQTIGELDLAEAGVPAGTALTLPWNVTDFDDLVMAGDSVELRTVTTNGLKLTDEIRNI